MEEIIKIYDNEIGIAFHWKNKSANLIQLIFRDTGFHLTVHEVNFFEKTLDSMNQKNSATCVKGDKCKSILD
ncbi:conserved protein of unknown function [Tenacibaculum soleae]|uniref:hypothetical protein n=1 Tax=Tenacibaculum soleae TaxID=447689 RepID=UPI003AB5A059